MSEKLSERTIAEGIVSRWIAAFRDDLGGKNARERLADLIHVALEQQLATKDAEIARLLSVITEFRRLLKFPHKGWKVRGDGIYTDHGAGPLIRDPHCSPTSLALICESLNFIARRKTALEIVDAALAETPAAQWCCKGNGKGQHADACKYSDANFSPNAPPPAAPEVK